MDDDLKRTLVNFLYAKIMDDDLARTLVIVLKRMREEVTENANIQQKYWSSPQREFEWTVLFLAKGDPKKLIEYLRSDRPILFDREGLATLLEYAQTPRGGPHRRMHVHSVAADALILYKRWREENIRRGVNDRRRCNDMKDVAARFSLWLGIFSQHIPKHLMQDRDAIFGAPMRADLSADDFETIRDLMDRPAKRLKIRS
jgi:hypothetical protein